MDNEKQLSEAVEKLTEEVKASNSVWRNFWKGMLFGIGSALGATVIAAVIVGILARVLHLFPYIEALIKK